MMTSHGRYDVVVEAEEVRRVGGQRFVLYKVQIDFGRLRVGRLQMVTVLAVVLATVH